MPRRGSLYCHEDCRHRTAQQRRRRDAVRRFAPWRRWFRHLPGLERAVLERRLAGQTHHAIGQVHGWTRQYSQQVEQRILRSLRSASRMTQKQRPLTAVTAVCCRAHGT
jgi:hypothetical protein